MSDVFAENQNSRSREMNGKRRVATFAEGSEKRALNRCGERCLRVAGAREKSGIAGPRLQGDCGLGRGGNHFFERKGAEFQSGEFVDSEAGKPGGGEECGIGGAVGDFLQACFDVPAQFAEFGFGEKPAGLGAAPRGPGGDFRGSGGGQVFPKDQNVSRIGTREASGEARSVGKCGGQVLPAVNGDIDFSGDESFFELGSEKALASGFFERPGEFFVSLRDKNFQRDGTSRYGFSQGGFCRLRLCECERASACADDDGLAKVRHFFSRRLKSRFCVAETKKLPATGKRNTFAGMVDTRDDVASAPVSYSRNILGLFGFATALCGLIFFWVPIAGVGLWALGSGLAFGGCFKTPRGYGFAGVFVSLISFVFMGYFLVLPSWLAEPVEKIVHGEVSSEKKNGNGQAATAGTSNSSIFSDILSSFRYDEVAGDSTGTPPVANPATEVAVADPVVGEEVSEPEEVAEKRDEAESVFDSVGEVGPSYRFPLAKFPEIAKKRTLWPRRVMLTRARTISLWDSDRKEIMGKMEIPAKTVVEVLDVRADGSLFVLDCTSQAFVVLAADTDFARVYLEKNRNDQGGGEDEDFE